MLAGGKQHGCPGQAHPTAVRGAAALGFALPTRTVGAPEGLATDPEGSQAASPRGWPSSLPRAARLPPELRPPSLRGLGGAAPTAGPATPRPTPGPAHQRAPPSAAAVTRLCSGLSHTSSRCAATSAASQPRSRCRSAAASRAAAAAAASSSSSSAAAAAAAASSARPLAMAAGGEGGAAVSGGGEHCTGPGGRHRLRRGNRTGSRGRRAHAQPTAPRGWTGCACALRGGEAGRCAQARPLHRNGKAAAGCGRRRSGGGARCSRGLAASVPVTGPTLIAA